MYFLQKRRLVIKILVPVKRVIDYNVNIRVKSDESGVETENVKMSMNPFDEIAVEEAIRIKEKGGASEVIIVSIGGAKCEETIRTALAMGADRGILILSDQDLEPLSIAKILKEIVNKEMPQLVITGKQAIDGDNNQVGQMLAGLLEWGQGTFASKLSLTENNIKVEREIDNGIVTIDVKLPAVVTVDLRLNEPRYVALPNIMKARTKPLEKISLEEINIDTLPRLEILKITEPEKRSGGIKVKDVEELIDKLKNEARVI